MKQLCIFCGANTGNKPEFSQLAAQTGRDLVHRGYGLVYGAGNVGLMGIIADAVLQAGGNAVGIIPGFLKDHEVAHHGLTELIITTSMHERKAIMAQRSDAFMALPGGFGTLDELFEILTWKQLQLHSKPVVLLNSGGFFEPLVQFIDHLVASGFLKPSNRELIFVTDQLETAFNYLEEYIPTVAEGKWLDDQLV